MIILGVNDGHDCGAVLVKDGRMIYAVNEERLSRVKMDSGFPYKSIEAVFENCNIDPKNINYVAVGNITKTTISSTSGFYGNRDRIKNLFKRVYYKIAAVNGDILEANYLIQLHKFLGCIIRNRKGISDRIRSYGINSPIGFYDHQICHISSAYYTSGYREAIIVSLDGGGDGYAGAVYRGINGRLEEVSRIPKINSIGVFWKAVTEACGFNGMRHGGKITGLAAYGKLKRTEKVYKQIRDLYVIDHEKLTIRLNNKIPFMEMRSWFERLKNKWGMEALAGAAQKLLEINIVGLIKLLCERYGKSNIALAGGIFANVRLNQKILELEQVFDIFIHPNMGDGGKAAGAALFSYFSKNDFVNNLSLEHVYLCNAPH